MPLPFRDRSKVMFPDTKRLAYSRIYKKIEQLRSKHPEILAMATQKMSQNINEFPPKFVPVPSWARNPEPGKAYWSPVMIVPSKRKVRLVFDAAASTNGTYLNDAFLKGPDFNNTLRAVLHRFRMKPIAFTADIQNMFHQFYVPEKDRTYLRFFWFKDNDHTKPLIEYWSCVHLQGLTGSPAIAEVARRYASKAKTPTNHIEWLNQEFLHPPDQVGVVRDESPEDRVLSRQFYVDDLLASADTPENVVHLLRQARFFLQRFNLYLCQIHSNNATVRSCFPESGPLPTIVNFVPSDASPIKEDSENTMAHSLGLQWNTEIDDLSVKTTIRNKNYTKRGLVSLNMSPFDPKGMISPAMLSGKLMQ